MVDINPSNAGTISEEGKFVFGSGPRVRLLRDLKSGIDEEELWRKYREPFLRKNLKKFRQRGLLTVDNGVYQLTSLGERVFDPWSQMVDLTVTIDKLGPFLSAFGPSWESEFVNLDILQESDVTVETVARRNVAVDRYSELVDQTNTLHEIVIWINEASDFHDRVMNGKLEAQYVYTSEVFEIVKDDTSLQEIAREHEETGQVRYYYLDRTFPYNLSILDDTVIIWMDKADESGLTVLLENDTDEMREWADEKFNKLKEEASNHSWEKK